MRAAWRCGYARRRALRCAPPGASLRRLALGYARRLALGYARRLALGYARRLARRA